MSDIKLISGVERISAIKLPFLIFYRLMHSSNNHGGCVIDDEYLTAHIRVYPTATELMGAPVTFPGNAASYSDWLIAQKPKLVRVWQGCTSPVISLGDWLKPEPVWEDGKPTYDVTLYRNESNHMEESLGTRFDNAALQCLYEYAVSSYNVEQKENKTLYNLIRGIELNILTKANVNDILVSMDKDLLAALKTACEVKTIKASKLIDIIKTYGN